MSYLIRTKLSRKSAITKFVGVHLPLHINNCLTIYSIANNMNKSILVENMLYYWMQNNYSKEVEEHCLDQIAKGLLDKYKVILTTRRCLSYKSFTNELITEFENKALTIPLIKKILDNLDKEYIKDGKNEKSRTT